MSKSDNELINGTVDEAYLYTLADQYQDWNKFVETLRVYVTFKEHMAIVKYSLGQDKGSDE